MKNLRIGAAGLALALTLALPAMVFAAPAQTTAVNYNTTLSDWNYGGLAYPSSGQLKLQLHPDGTISGWYTNSDTISFIPVIGGENGQNVWLDIGQEGNLHVNAHLQNGKLIGSAVQGIHLFDFSATPA